MGDGSAPPRTDSRRRGGWLGEFATPGARDGLSRPPSSWGFRQRPQGELSGEVGSRAGTVTVDRPATSEHRGSIRDEGDCRRGASLLRQGSVVGSFIRGVCGIWVNGNDPLAIGAAYRIKGERRGGRPFGLILDAHTLTGLIDRRKIAPSTWSLLLDEEQLASRLGSLCFIRYPVREEAAASLSPSLVSSGAGGPWLQSWMPGGCEAVTVWMRQIREQGINLPVASSMNVSGQPELVDQEEGVRFCLQHDIPLFLGDTHQPAAQGSFPILQVDATGVRVIREGHFPNELFDALLDRWDVERTNVQLGKYPLVVTHSLETALATDPRSLRLEMITRLDGPLE
jgi:hypothetical protein